MYLEYSEAKESKMFVNLNGSTQLAISRRKQKEVFAKSTISNAISTKIIEFVV
jgi:hypothetical protein